MVTSLLGSGPALVIKQTETAAPAIAVSGPLISLESEVLQQTTGFPEQE